MARRARSVAVLALVAACAPLARTAPADGQERVYVTVQDGAAVAVVDAATGALLETVDLTAMGFDATARPHHVAVEPDGSHWYVSLIGGGKVLKLDRENRLVGQVDFETPGMLALDPESDLLYVGRSMAAVRPPQRLGVIDRARMSIEEIGVFVPRPHALAVDTRRDRVYTASLGENRIAWAPLASEDVELVPIEGPMQMVVQFALSPDGRWLVGGGQMTGDLIVWDVTGSEPERVREVHLGGQPWHPVFLPDGSELWVPNLTEGNVAVVDTRAWEVVAEVEHPALVEPHGSAVTRDGRTVYVSARNTSGAYEGAPGGVLLGIDTATREVRSVTPVGPYASGVGVATPR